MPSNVPQIQEKGENCICSIIGSTKSIVCRNKAKCENDLNEHFVAHIALDFYLYIFFLQRWELQPITHVSVELMANHLD